MGFVLPLELTIPANTLEVAAVRSDAVVLPAGGSLDSLLLHVPSGHRGNVPVRLDLDGARYQPTQGEFRLNDVPDLELLTAPVPIGRTARLTLLGWNLDAVDAHTVRALAIGRYASELNRRL